MGPAFHHGVEMISLQGVRIYTTRNLNLGIPCRDTTGSSSIRELSPNPSNQGALGETLCLGAVLVLRLMFFVHVKRRRSNLAPALTLICEVSVGDGV